MMLTHALRVALAVALAFTFGLRSAHADIYTWVDETGVINVSNLAPPDGVRVINVMRASPPSAAARQTQALTDRVQQLEDEVALARPQAPPAPYAPVVLPPPVVQYVIAPPVVQYVINESAPIDTSCDPSWAGCAFGSAPLFYPTSVVVVRPPGFGHGRPPHPGQGFAPPSGPTSLIQPLATPIVQPLVGPQVPPLIPALRPSDGFFRRG